MCDTDEKIPKWKCDYCTYENFPSSIKCTMCKGAKPLLNEDIFRLSPPHTVFDNEEERGAVAYLRDATILPQTHNTASGNVSGCNKWTCKVCTYRNWPRSLRCVQCCTKKGTTLSMLNSVATTATSTSTNTTSSLLSSSTSTMINSAATITLGAQAANDELSYNCENDKLMVENNNEATLKLKDQLNVMCLRSNDIDTQFDVNLHNNKSKNINNSDSGLSSSHSCSTNINSHRSVYNQRQQQNNLNLQNTQQQNFYVTKWVCNLCTYENWPKSLKCSMCAEPRAANSASGESVIPSFSMPTTTTTTKTAVTTTDCIINEQDELQLHKDTVSTNNSLNIQQNIYQFGSSETINNCDTERSERQRQMRRKVDWQWLGACLGVVENNYSAVETYLTSGGDPARALTANEVAVLNRDSAFDVGHTLIHLAIRFHREEMLPMLLSQISGSGPGIKRVPSYVAPDLAADIRRHFANMLRMRKSMFNCHYVQEHATFALPAEIEELPMPIQEQLYEELLDRDAQKQLENPPPALNWSLEITARLGSRLLVLWNRSAGDCLLDSAMQATWGVFDRDNTLRRALADTLHQCAHIFYPRWREYEMWQAAMLNFTLEEAQWEEDWSSLLTLASQPGSSLEQLHIFALAHILRRPIIVYGVKNVKSFRGEDIGYARFEGLYLPLFWDQNFCIKSPIALGYTRGHFCALVPMEPFARIDSRREDSEDVTYLPLMDCELKLLPIHFLTQAEMGREESIMRQWLDVCVTEGGLLVAQQKLRKRPLLVAQMLEEWLNHYRRIAQVISAPFARRPHNQTGYSSDGDSDEE